MMQTIMLLCILAATPITPGKVRFNNYNVYRLLPNTTKQLNTLQTIEDALHGTAFWKIPSEEGVLTNIFLPQKAQKKFLPLMDKFNISSSNTIRSGVQREASKQRPRRMTNAFDWTKYESLSRINGWLDLLVERNPGIVIPIIGGVSYEGRDIKGVKVSYKRGNMGVFLEAGIHAREWISTATVTYILNELLTSTDPSIRDIAENYDWYVFPSVNPDGYEYSHKQNRTWRKNRKPNPGGCFGTDLNRNWNSYWNVVGASSDPCSHIYAGTSAFSEIESWSLAQYLSHIVSNIQVYLSFHSSGQMLAFPYGYTAYQAPHHNQLMAITKNAALAMKKLFGTKYIFGSIASIIYEASGSSVDWVYQALGINFTIAFELRDDGKYGFLLPPTEIIPTSMETLESVASILRDVRNMR